MNIDPDTNLPQLPEGYFWRVRNADSMGDVKVSLRKRMALGSRSVGHGYAFGRLYSHCGITAEKIQQAAVLIYLEWEQKGEDRIAYNEFAGDYPPKRLG